MYVTIPAKWFTGLDYLHANASLVKGGKKPIDIVFGGFAPLTITWMIHLTGNIAPAFYLIGAAILSIGVVGITVGHGNRRKRSVAIQTS
jgi:hypothetical protein